MDTISRDTNSSYLPVAGVIVGLLALVLSAVALVKVTAANKTLATHDEKIGRIDGIESQASSAGASAERAAKELATFRGQVQTAFNDVGNALGELRGNVTTLQESAKKQPAVAGGAKGAPKEPAVAGPGEYVVKQGDSSGAKIARDHGVPLADLIAVNPGVNWSSLKIGQKIKLPQKR